MDLPNHQGRGGTRGCGNRCGSGGRGDRGYTGGRVNQIIPNWHQMGMQPQHMYPFVLSVAQGYQQYEDPHQIQYQQGQYQQGVRISILLQLDVIRVTTAGAMERVRIQEAIASTLSKAMPPMQSSKTYSIDATTSATENFDLLVNSTMSIIYIVTAKLDSGVSKHYIRPEDKQCLSDAITVPPYLVGLPDKKLSKITQQGLLTLIQTLTPSAQTEYILNDLKRSTLLSAGKLCDDDCAIILNKTMERVQKDNKTILQGPRNV